MIAVLAATTNEPNVGWGKLIGLLVGGGLAWLIISAYERYKTMNGQPLSPTIEGAAPVGVNPQINTGSDPAMTPSREVATTTDGDLDSFVRARVGKVRTNRLIVAAQQRYRVSESTAKRALRRARKDGQS